MLVTVMYAAFSIRPAALTVLLRPGGYIDQFFGYTGGGAGQLSDTLYDSGYAGAFQSNYLRKNLERRGLLNSSPALSHFPFYEDAAPIYNAMRTFTGAFVDSYYADGAAIAADVELQAWLKEASGPAQVIDFPTPSSLKEPSDLADVLAHMAHLVSTSHHAVNLNQLLTGSGVLPFHPTALYKPIPTAKGVTDVVSYLPPLEKAIGFLRVESAFARPLLAGTPRSLVHMFDDALMLRRMNAATRKANDVFKATMRARSEVVQKRTFDEKGLSQGMPFLWKALDPDVIPWSVSI